MPSATTTGTLPAETDTAITTTDQVHATFAPDSRSVAAARRFIRRTLLDWGAASVVDDALLLVSELVTNAVVHAGTQTDVTCSRYEGGIQVDVLDRYPARGLPVEVPAADSSREGGRGLHLSSALASAWGVEYTRAAKRVWFRLEVPGAVSHEIREPATGAQRARQPVGPDGVQVAALVVDSAGLVEQWNAAATEMFGWSPAQAVGRDLADLLAWPHQPAAPVSLVEVLTYARWQGGYGVRHADGRLVPVFASHLATTGADGQAAVACLLVPEAQRGLLEAPLPAPSRPPAGSPDGASDAAVEWAGLADPASARLGLDELLGRVVERVRDGMAGDAAFVLLTTDDEAELEMRAATGLASSERFARLPLEGLTGRMVSPRLPVVQPDLSQDPTVAPYLDGSRMRCLLTVPLLVEGRLTGVLGVATEQPGRYGNDDAIRLESAAGRIALPVESARLAELYRVRRGWVSFLAEASDLLAGTLDPRKTLAIVAQLVVPRLATWCAVQILEPDREPRLEYVWHQDEGRIDGLRALLEAAPQPEQRAVPGARAWSGLGEVEQVPATPAAGAESAGDVVITLPLVARGHSLGTLLLGRPPGDRFRRDVLDLAEDLSRRAALALDNARLYSERAATSHALQRSLLPPELPDVPGLDVGVVYQAAGEGNDVGGDFYDLFTIDAERWGFAIGDVCGTGAEAAAVTGLARHALRILGRSGYPVPDVLGRLNEAILGEGSRSRFLTLLYGEATPRAGGGLRLTLVSAGHPLPLRLSADGKVTVAGSPQPLLGVLDELDLKAETLDLDPGDTLVCVTDGVTERRNGPDMLDDDGLARVVGECTGLGAGAVAARIQRAVASFAPEPPRDDMAILVLRAR
jgi:PAS domain S-box-containing protein